MSWSTEKIAGEISVKVAGVKRIFVVPSLFYGISRA